MPAEVADATIALDTEPAAVTGQTVVVSAIVCVTTTLPVALRAGQLVTLAAQLNIVLVWVAKMVSVVCSSELVEADAGELLALEIAPVLTPVVATELIVEFVPVEGELVI